MHELSDCPLEQRLCSPWQIGTMWFLLLPRIGLRRSDAHGGHHLAQEEASPCVCSLPAPASAA